MLKERTKKGLTDNGWNVMCNVDRVVIDVTERKGYLYLPELNYPDMESTINCFLSVDPECKAIYTFVDNKPDTAYLFESNVNKWVSYRRI